MKKRVYSQLVALGKDLSKLILRAGIGVAFMLMGAGAALAQGRVTDVAIRTDLSSLQSRVCPVTVVFNGYIAMDGPGTVTYQIVRSDGATSAVYSVGFAKDGVHTVRETWTLGDASALPHYEGWMAIRVLTPNEVESNHADGNFIMTCNTATPEPPQPQRARFRVSLTGFSCFRETRDHIFEVDGPRDEIYQAPFVLTVERTGVTGLDSIGLYGPIFRRISTGTSFPTSTPWILTGTPIGLGVPGVLFEGELIEGERAVAIAPTLWEWDGINRLQLSSFWGACAAARSRIASAVVPVITGPFPARYGGLGTSLDGLITIPITPEGNADRPIGISVFGSTGSFTPRFLLLTYEGAMNAVSGASLGLDTYAFNYADPDGFNGDYTLYVKVEQIP